jgi:hypothetical protein
LLALRDLGEPVYETTPGGASASLNEVDKNIEQADRYLQLQGIFIPW